MNLARVRIALERLDPPQSGPHAVLHIRRRHRLKPVRDPAHAIAVEAIVVGRTFARRLHAGTTDAELVDEALTALLARYRSAEIDAAYEAAYGAHPIDGEDDWGDLASFRGAASAT